MKLIRSSIIAVAFFCGQIQAGSIDACLTSAAQHPGVDPMLLRAIASVESSFNPTAVGKNVNGTQDRGLMQINDWWLPKLTQFGITRKDLMDPCVSAYVGAWILSQELVRHGRTWRAVGAYNSPTAKNQEIYVRKVQRKLNELVSLHRH